jgi:hypothetical protein
MQGLQKNIPDARFRLTERFSPTLCLQTFQPNTTMLGFRPQNPEQQIRLILVRQWRCQPLQQHALVIADTEHFSSELLQHIRRRPMFDLLVPIPNQPAFRNKYQAIAEAQFTPRWAGFATTKVPYEIRYGHGGNYWMFVERSGERPADWRFKGFLSSMDTDEVTALVQDYPKRWHIEEFFNANQALGWHRAGTMNLNIRYAQMTLALIAQTVIHQLRSRLGEPYRSWDADHLARDLFFALDGDVRVKQDTILVTYYNAPNVEQLRTHYEDLPNKLQQQGLRPEIPWLYGYKLDFRFR